jgi:uncharacterized Ntn-hydrolase superfamily protein
VNASEWARVLEAGARAAWDKYSEAAAAIVVAGALFAMRDEARRIAAEEENPP